MIEFVGDRAFAVAMTAVKLVFMGQFALWTYLRPFLESAAGLSVSMLRPSRLSSSVAF